MNKPYIIRREILPGTNQFMMPIKPPSPWDILELSRLHAEGSAQVIYVPALPVWWHLLVSTPAARRIEPDMPLDLEEPKLRTIMSIYGRMFTRSVQEVIEARRITREEIENEARNDAGSAQAHNPAGTDEDYPEEEPAPDPDPQD